MGSGLTTSSSPTSPFPQHSSPPPTLSPTTIRSPSSPSHFHFYHQFTQSLKFFHHIFHPKLSNYHIGGIIGRGGFGLIREIQNKRNSKWYALKIYNLYKINKEDIELISHELLVLHQLPSHPFIIHLYHAFQTSKSLLFILDLYSGGDLRLLFHLNYEFTQYHIAYIIGCIGMALHHIHQHGIIHRDIKPENIMFNNYGIPKLIDFGISYIVSSESNHSCICNYKSGTKLYMAPEIFVPETHYHSFESDFWSLGIVMYEMIFHKRPYDRCVPIDFIQYSQDLYQSKWIALLVNENKLTTTTPAATAPGGTTATGAGGGVGGAKTTTTTETNSMYSIDSIHQRSLSNFFLHNEIPLPDYLTISIPNMTYLNEPTSAECCNLLSSLLDVRLHKRLGVGSNFLQFITHPWFLMNKITFNNITTISSPLILNLNDISMHLWHKFYSLNMDETLNLDENLSSPSSSSISSDVQEFLQKIHLILPIYLESDDKI